jgi:hypothetical protein
MPTVSKKQERFMQAVAHNPAFAKKVGVPVKVGKEFTKSGGGEMKESKAMVKKEVSFMKKKGAPKSMIKHEMAEAGMKKGGVKKMALGGAAMGAVRKAAAAKAAPMLQKAKQAALPPGLTKNPSAPTQSQMQAAAKNRLLADYQKQKAVTPHLEMGKLTPAHFAQQAAQARAQQKFENSQKQKGVPGNAPPGITKPQAGAARTFADYQRQKARMMGIGSQMASKPQQPDAGVVARAFADYQKQKAGVMGQGPQTAKKMASGGLAAGHKEADGIAKKGKTRAMQVKMAGGGKTKKYC